MNFLVLGIIINNVYKGDQMKLNRKNLRRMILNEIKSLLSEDATVGDLKKLCFSKLGTIKNKAAAGKIEDFKTARNKLIDIKDDNATPEEIKTILSNFNNKLAAAFYAGKNHKNADAAIKKKFGTSGTEASKIIDRMSRECKE